MFYFKISPEINEKIQKRLGIPEGGYKLTVTAPPPDILSKAAFEITTVLAGRFGLDNVPDVLWF